MLFCEILFIFRCLRFVHSLFLYSHRLDTIVGKAELLLAQGRPVVSYQVSKPGPSHSSGAAMQMAPPAVEPPEYMSVYTRSPEHAVTASASHTGVVASKQADVAPTRQPEMVSTRKTDVTPTRQAEPVPTRHTEEPTISVPTASSSRRDTPSPGPSSPSLSPARLTAGTSDEKLSANSSISLKLDLSDDHYENAPTSDL